MKNGFTEIFTRACLSYYVERRLSLDLDPNIAPPARLQIVLLNRQELEKARTTHDAGQRISNKKSGTKSTEHLLVYKPNEVRTHIRVDTLSSHTSAEKGRRQSQATRRLRVDKVS
jgi:hypothetical protein